MKIMLIEPFGRRISHAPQYVRDTSLALAVVGVGIEIAIVTFDGVMGDWINRENNIEQFSVIPNAKKHISLAKLVSNFLRSVSLIRIFDLPFDTFQTFHLALKVNKKGKYDVIHVLDSSMPLFSFLIFANRQKNNNLVFTLHSDINALSENSLEKLHFVDFIKKLLFQNAIKKNSIGFICFSNIVRESFESTVYYDKITVVPGPRPLPKSYQQEESRKHLGLPQEKRILLCFGINHNWKDYETIFQAEKDLPDDIIILFAGKIRGNDSKRDPRQLAVKYCVKDKTIIIDEYISEEEVPYYFSAADAVILAYTKGFIAHASSLMDAAQYGVPVIAIDSGSTGEDVKAWNMGVTFSSEDSVSLRGAILKFVALSEIERQEIKGGLQKYAHTISWEQVANSHVRVYQELLHLNYTNKA